jgi:hypothetical protein
MESGGKRAQQFRFCFLSFCSFYVQICGDAQRAGHCIAPKAKNACILAFFFLGSCVIFPGACDVFVFERLQK